MGKEINLKIVGLLLIIFVNSPILFSFNSVYWDDWVIFNTEFSEIFQRFSEVGVIFNWVSFFHYGMMNFLGPWAYKVMAFLVFLANAGLFVRVLRLYGFLRSELIVTFFLVTMLPLFCSRYVAINIIYLLNVSFFLIAWLIHFRAKLVSYLLFFSSFTMGSLLFCFPVFLVFESIRLSSNNQLFYKKWHFFALILLPISYFFIKTHYYTPNGAYSQYQVISVGNILPSLSRVPEVTEWTVREIILQSTISDWIVSLLIIALIAKLFNFGFRSLDFGRATNQRFIFSIFSLSCVMALSILPYALIGNELNFFYGFESRNQALLIFPLSALISVILNFLLSRKLSFTVGKIFLIFLFSAGSFLQFAIYIAYMNDHFKTQAIISALSGAGIRDDQFNFVFQDFSEVKFTEQRRLSFYEYSGIMRLALERNAIFARDEIDWNGGVCFKDFAASALYNNQGFNLRTNNDVTRLRIQTEGGVDFPVIGLRGYDLLVEQEPGLAWCQDVCADCGFAQGS